MKIVRPTEVTVTFDDYRDAAKFLAQYVCPPEQRREIVSEPCPDNGVPINRQCAREAVRVLAAKFGGLTLAQADPQHAAPTYVSGSSDRVYLISEMPTRYIRNVLGMDGYRQSSGLVRVLKDELARRGEGWR